MKKAKVKASASKRKMVEFQRLIKSINSRPIEVWRVVSSKKGEKVYGC